MSSYERPKAELSTAEDKMASDDDASLESLAGSDFTTSSEEEKEYHCEGSLCHHTK